VTDRDPEATLDAWKESMAAEHETAIADPDPETDHRLEGISQVSYRVRYDYDPAIDELVETGTERVHDLEPPERLGCSCGVRGMSRDEARRHLAAARDENP
jgi:hypothetical protein